MAQSVPDATLIPCIHGFPPGWEFTGAFSRSTESMLLFTTDTFDLEVEVALTEACDVSSASQTDSPRSGTQLFVGSDGRTFSYRFTGGCITFEYETSQLAESNEGLALMEAIGFMTRDTLRDLSGWTL